MTDLMTSWVKGWMLGKYEKYNELDEGDNFDEWIEGYKWGVTEIGEFENWVYHFAVKILIYLFAWLGKNSQYNKSFKINWLQRSFLEDTPSSIYSAPSPETACTHHKHPQDQE